MPRLSLSPENLHTHVVETVRRALVKPIIINQRFGPLPADRVEQVSRVTLDTMLTRQFRVGPLPSPEVYQQLLQRVRSQVSRGRPICVTIGYGPLKNQLGVNYSRADWAELFALCHLTAWHNKVQAVYPPGLKIRIVFDDSTLVMANRADRGLMKTYMRTIDQLIDVLALRPLFLPYMRQSSFAWLFHFGPYQIARWRVRRWERDPANHELLERMTESARRNVLTPSGLSPDEQEQYIRAAGHRYRVYWEALQLTGLTRSKSRIVAMYLDGSQHHIRQTVAMHLTTLDKGQVTQPWQGEGALLDNGHGKLEPFVLTAGRRQRHETQLIATPDLVGMPGFERIRVASPSL